MKARYNRIGAYLLVSILLLIPAAYPAPIKYFNLTFTDYDCYANISITSHTGQFTLYLNMLPDMCTQTTDSLNRAIVSTYQTSSVLGLNMSPGTYIAAVEGVGRYSLTKDSFCNIDITSPTMTTDFPGYVSKTTILEAIASDSNAGINATSCEVCISDDGQCDFEWTDLGTTFTEISSTKGICRYQWNTNSTDQGTYKVNIRARDTQGNLGFGTESDVVVDNIPPTIGSIDIPSHSTSDSEFDVYVAIDDNAGLQIATLSFTSEKYNHSYQLTEGNDGVYEKNGSTTSNQLTMKQR